jgi:uncharacterized membrane protein YebE (DUF533 family)
MHKPSESALKLVGLIKRAISDGVISNAEYEEILAVADADGHHDRQEQRLLNQLHEMISNGTVKRVK